MAEKSEGPKYPGIDPCFDSVVDRWGREMFALCMQAGLASAAGVQLMGLVERLGSGSAASRQNSHIIAQALRVLAGGFNEMSNELIKAKGWKAEEIEACNAAIEQAWSAKLSQTILRRGAAKLEAQDEK